MRRGRNAGAISWLDARSWRDGWRRRQRLHVCRQVPHLRRSQDELPGRHAVRTALCDRLIDLLYPSAVAPMAGHQRWAHAAAAVEMAACTVHLAEQLFAFRDGELVSLEPPPDRVRRERSAAVGEKAGDGNLVGSVTRTWGSVLLRRCVIGGDCKHRGKGD